MESCLFGSVRPTDKLKLRGEDTVESSAVHRKHDGKVDSHAAPDEEMIDGSPVTCVQAHLQSREDGRTSEFHPLPVLSSMTESHNLNITGYRGHTVHLRLTCRLTTMMRLVDTVTASDWWSESPDPSSRIASTKAAYGTKKMTMDV